MTTDTVIIVQATHDFHGSHCSSHPPNTISESSTNGSQFRKDYNENNSNQIQPPLLSFCCGTTIQISSSTDHGWSYGIAIMGPHGPITRTEGWFPTSYVTNNIIHNNNGMASSSLTRHSSTNRNGDGNDDIVVEYNHIQNNWTEDQRQDDTYYSPPTQQPQPPSPSWNVSSTIQTNDNAIGSDDDGFFDIPMGYTEPQSYDDDETTRTSPLDREQNDDIHENVESLPPGVRVAVVPDRRQRISYLPRPLFLPQKWITTTIMKQQRDTTTAPDETMTTSRTPNGIATTTTREATPHGRRMFQNLHRNRNGTNRINPAVYLSP
jgi:hypothetical protein